ncbi:MAG: GNAT family N-acetyltransferase [Oscillospiraceae bacterium]|nr:GNAT family N-acetyltransferase [Oscillospiraceae bacterium]
MTHLGTVTLETERLILRRFTLDDAEAMFRNWASDPKVTKFLMWQPHESVAVSKSILEQWVNSYQSPEYYSWAIVPKSLGEPIGNIAVVYAHPKVESLEICYSMGTAWWNQGIMTEALKAVIQYLFEQVGARRVDATYNPINVGSGRVMAKAGMRYEGTLRGMSRNNMGITDKAYYAILADDYFHRGTEPPTN